MFFGVVSLDTNISVDLSITAEMSSIFNRDNNMVVDQIKDANCFILYSNIAALSDCKGIYSDKKNRLFSVLAGEPFLGCNGIKDDHHLFIKSINQDDYKVLESSRGVFCAACCICKDDPILFLCTDKLGVRPLYYWHNGNYVVFATQLKLLENLSFIPKKLDEAALSEIVGLGFSLGTRTKYTSVKILREAEIIKFTRKGAESSTYWRWDKIEQQSISSEEATAQAYRLFKEAIGLRLHADTDALAFLSGGMDSRAIIGALSEMGVRTQAFNFSFSQSQDQAFAIHFAELIGCQLNLDYHDGDFPLGFRCQLANMVQDLVEKQKMEAARPRAIWSGDGGSVSFWCVYLDENVVEIMRAGKKRKAIQTYRKNNSCHLPLKAMRKNKAEDLSDYLDNAILAEIDRLDCDDPAQSLFLFLMFNDQRRHLHDVFEEIDVHRLEYQLPFFDSKLLEHIFSLPLDYRLNHKFYTDWFKVFPSAVTSVPWQTYPGHVPCPLPYNENLDYQWDKKKINFKSKLKRNAFGIQGLRICLFAPSIGPLSRGKFGLVSTVHILGIRNYDYLIEAGKIYSNYL
jgi:hypothetical protein